MGCAASKSDPKPVTLGPDGAQIQSLRELREAQSKQDKMDELDIETHLFAAF